MNQIEDAHRPEVERTPVSAIHVLEDVHRLEVKRTLASTKRR